MMNTLKTPDEITTEIEKLEALFSVVPHYAFTNDNHWSIAVQIRVLKREVDWYDFDKQAWPDNVLFAADDADNWLFGYDPQPPSVFWRDLI